MENRIPNEFFTFNGAGDSKYESHAGSYHIALNNANISDYNIITYSSVLPKTAKEIEYNISIMPVFGSELMCIIAHSTGCKHDKLLAGVCYCWLRDKLGNKIGGLVVECTNKNINKSQMENHLRTVIEDLRLRTYSDYYLTELKMIINEHMVEDNYGSCITGLAFVSFL